MPVITIRHATDEEIERAKSLTGKKTASQGFVACADELAALRTKHKQLVQEATLMESELRQARAVIQQTASSAKELLSFLDKEETIK